MNKEKIIRYQAHSLLLQYRIQTVTLDNLVYIIEDQGYEIVEYGSEDFESQHLLDKMGLTAYLSKQTVSSGKYLYHSDRPCHQKR